MPDPELTIWSVMARAIELFEDDVNAAHVWLQAPLPVLRNRSPLEAARTAAGAQEVLDLIGHPEHGVFC